MVFFPTLTAYLTAFAVSLVPTPYRTHHRRVEIDFIVDDIASTDCEVDKCAQLVLISWRETNFERKARGLAGEIGAYQIMPPAQSYGAKEALRRLRAQGIQGYCGCVSWCPKTIEARSWEAELWMMAFDPPPISGRVSPPIATRRWD
jgi:hypothetical protein